MGSSRNFDVTQHDSRLKRVHSVVKVLAPEATTTVFLQPYSAYWPQKQQLQYSYNHTMHTYTLLAMHETSSSSTSKR